MSYYEQYLAVRSDSPDDYQQMFPKVPLLINAALDLAEGVARYADKEPNGRICATPSNATYIQIPLETGMLAIESNANPLTERPHTVTTALASLAMDREHYNVVRNVFSEKSSGRQRLESCLFRVKALQEAPELCKEPPRKEMATRYRIYGIVLRRGNVMPIIGSSLDTDETYRRNLLPSETRIQPLNMHRVVNHRFQTTIDLMAGFAGMRA